jgi:hypothetical protein
MMRFVAAALAPLDAWIWIGGTFLEAGVFVMAVYRGVQRRFPIFTTYLGLVILREGLQWWMFHRGDPLSARYFYVYWISQAVLLTARGLIIGELFYSAVKPYRGVWMMARILLLLTATSLLVYAAVKSANAAGYLGSFVLATERGLEFTVVGTLLALLAVCRYYRLGLDPMTRAIALGLALYSSLVIVNNSILFVYILPYFRLWSFLRRVSFHAALVVWGWPLLQPLAEIGELPAMASPSHYQELAPELSNRMRQLNNRLLSFLQR